MIGRLRRSLRKHGVVRTLVLCARYPFSAVYNRFLLFYPSAYRRRRLEREFDLLHGVETIGNVPVDELRASSANLAYSQPYGPTPLGTFDLKEVLANLGIAYDEFTFIDFGSGKGRALFLASDFAFKRIIGIEYSPDLNRIAERNIATYRNNEQKCHDLRSLCMDAVEYHLPPDPCVLYFANPFLDYALHKVITSIYMSFVSRPREIFVIYFNPICAHVFDTAHFLRKIKALKSCALYRVKLPI